LVYKNKQAELPYAATNREKMMDQSSCTRNHSIRVLIVDDEEFLVNMWKMSLERRGYAVTAMRSSKSALEAFQKEPDAFDIVVTDQTMPEMAGNCLAAELLSIRENLPIVICTGYSDIIDEEQAKKLGIREYLMKPFDIRQLENVIQRLVGSQIK
jgi:DNA-binding NtrC family response regulator